MLLKYILLLRVRSFQIARICMMVEVLGMLLTGVAKVAARRFLLTI